MKGKKNPSEFLGAKVLSTFDDARIKVGAKKHDPKYVGCDQYLCQQQIDPPTQQQQIQNAF